MCAPSCRKMYLTPFVKKIGDGLCEKCMRSRRVRAMKIFVQRDIFFPLFCMLLLSCAASESAQYSVEKISDIVSAPNGYNGKRVLIHGCVEVDRHGMLLVECGKSDGIAIELSDAYAQRKEVQSFLQIAPKNWLPNVNSKFEGDYYGEFFFKPDGDPRRILVLHSVKNMTAEN